MKPKNSQSLLKVVASQKALKANKAALESFDQYKEVTGIIERVDLALGRKPRYQTSTGSSINFEMKTNGTTGTSTQSF